MAIINEQTKVTLQIGGIATIIWAVFALWGIYFKHKGQQERNTADIQVLYQLDKDRWDERSAQDSSIKVIETKVQLIWDDVSEIKAILTK